MKLSIQIGVLREAIQQASHTLDTKSGSNGAWVYLIAQKQAPILPTDGSVKDKLFVYSSNLGLLRTLAKVSCEVEVAGEVAVMPKLLLSSLNGLPADESVQLTLSSGKLEVKYATVRSFIATLAGAMKSQTFMKTIPFNAKPTTSISATTLVDLINRTLFCAAEGDNTINDGPWLSSIYVETDSDSGIRAVGTNKIIAGQARMQDPLLEPGFKTSLHRDALIALKSLLTKRKQEEVTITVVASDGAENEVLFRFSDIILGVRLLGKAYPKAVLGIFEAPPSTTVLLDRQKLLGILSRLTAFAESNSLGLTFNEDKVTILTKGYNSVFQEQLSFDSKVKTETRIGLGIQDLSNILSTMVSDTVVIKYTTPVARVYFFEGSDASGFRYILSPVTLEWEKDK